MSIVITMTAGPDITVPGRTAEDVVKHVFHKDRFPFIRVTDQDGTRWNLAVAHIVSIREYA